MEVIEAPEIQKARRSELENAVLYEWDGPRYVALYVTDYSAHLYWQKGDEYGLMEPSRDRLKYLLEN